MKLKTLGVLLDFLVTSMAYTSAETDFSAVEEQQVSVATPGLFVRSNAFSIDFTDLKSNEYSFPLPIGRASAQSNGSLKITTRKGDIVLSMFDGTVRLSKNIEGQGNVVVVRHNNGLETVYAGNSQNLVKVGQRVRTGQRVAIVGGEGKNTYCMFSIMVNGGRINPATLMGIKTHKLYKQQVVFKKNGINVDLSVNKEGVHEEEKPLFGSDYNPFENSSVFKLNLEQISDEAWCYPLPGSHVISPYGGGRNHAGVDVKTCPNDKIHAAFDGVVTMSGPYFGYGNCIVIKHGWGLETLYSHQSRNLVSVGQYVKAGDVIGLTGRTGRATTEHLHFEIHFKGHRFNPAVIFNHSKKCLQCSTITFTQSGCISSKSNG